MLISGFFFYLLCKSINMPKYLRDIFRVNLFISLCFFFNISIAHFLLSLSTYVHMADHAGGRRSLVNPGTKLWRPPVEEPSFGARGAVLAPIFVRPKKISLMKRRDNSMKQKLLEMIQISIWLHTD